MFKRFVLLYLILHLAAILLLLFFISTSLDRHWFAATRTQLAQVSAALRLSIHLGGLTHSTAEGETALRNVAKESELRITLVSGDGKVLFDTDSNPSRMDNHSGRSEIAEAADRGEGYSRRISDTTGLSTSYFARRLDPEDADSPFLRVAIADTPLIVERRSLQRLIWIFGLTLSALSAVVMWSYAFRQIRPMQQFADAARRIASGQAEQVPLVLERNDEWQDLSQAFQHMQSELAAREQRLLENSERLEAVLSSMVEGVIAIDPAGQIMLCNDAACDMLELRFGQVIGRRLGEQVRVPQLLQAVEQTRQQRNYATVEFQTSLTNRRAIQARVACLPGTERPGVTIVMHDVTELRSLESLRRDFVANVSHELKTPLSAIKALAETLRLGAIDNRPAAFDFVRQIERQADLLHKQIQDLLQLARVESGQASFEIVRVPLQGSLMQSLQQLQGEAAARRIELALDPVDPRIYARVDAEAFATITENLVVNAIRYSHDGGTVRLRAWLEQDRAVVSVSDQGIGIAPEHQRRIFERFYRVDRARSREAGGTGLGLSIVKHLVQAFGGSVRVESRLGQGATFIVGLPGGME